MLCKKALSAILILSLLTFSACGQSAQSPEPPSDENAETEQSGEEEQPEESESEEPEEEQEEAEPENKLQDFSTFVNELKGHNEDSVGWLHIPDTTINDVVMFYPDDVNQYYIRRDFEKNFSYEGSYFIDFRSEIGEGKRKDLDKNICVYGVTLADQPESEAYNIRLGSLHNFRNEDFAREHPYIYFSTLSENLMYEVVAVFITHTNIHYNVPSPDDYLEIFETQIKPRSLYLYDTEVDENDKFLTVSTAIYNLPDGTEVDSNGYLRYAVVGRLVDENEPLKETATFTVNPNPVIDLDNKYNA